MNINFANPGARLVAKIAGGVLVVGALLDTISNALTIISPWTTYVGTALAVLAMPVLWLLRRGRLLTLQHQNGDEFLPFDRSLIAPTVAILAVLWIPRAFEHQGSSAPEVVTQREVLEILGPKTYDVFYPRPFASPPNLNFSKKVDKLYFHVDYDVIEQRRDGFRISVTSSQSGAAIEWIAVGVVAKSSPATK
jgi:hypothetical protein